LSEEYQRSTMSMTVVQQKPHWVIRLDGELNSGCAVELRTLLLAWRAAGTDLEWDCSRASELDLTILQLMEAARREARQQNLRFSGQPSEAVAMAVRAAGFVDLEGCLGGGA